MHNRIREFMRRPAAFLMAAMAALTALPSLASYDINIPPPASPVAAQMYDLHMFILWICVAIFIVVFSAMFYSVFKFRKSQGAKADVNFHESTLIEIIWTVIPFFILIGMAIPATRTVLDMKDASHSDITIKVTGYQWGWQYEYQQDGLSFYSTLSTPWSQIGQPGVPATEAKGKDYLLEVDNPMVVPAGKKVRLLITSNDVIHSWYVPVLGVNQYGIPGFIKDTWFKADKPGAYKGQCNQICGKLHGYMPITVIAKTENEYADWVKQTKTKFALPEVAAAVGSAADASPVAPAATAEDSNKKYTLAELEARGQQVYTANCVACHQANGMGLPNMFPALNKSKVVLGSKAEQIKVVLNGRPGTAMAPFARLSDSELAAVITYTRNSWDNKSGDAIQPAEIKSARK
jgi:cytochrome c oxidase subunit 2